MKKTILALIILPFAILLTSCVPKMQILETPEAKTKNIVNKSDKNSNFIKANEWMVQTFGNAESVIQFTDKEAGIVKGKYIMKEGFVSTNVYAKSTSAYYSIITIRVKNEASRIEIVAPSGMYSQKYMNIEYGFTPEMFNAASDILIANFEEHMLKKSANDSW